MPLDFIDAPPQQAYANRTRSLIAGRIVFVSNLNDLTFEPRPSVAHTRKKIPRSPINPENTIYITKRKHPHPIGQVILENRSAMLTSRSETVYASSPLTTSPLTSVSRKSRPWKR